MLKRNKKEKKKQKKEELVKKSTIQKLLEGMIKSLNYQDETTAAAYLMNLLLIVDDLPDERK